MDLTEEEIERRRELKRLRNARYRAKQRGEAFDEEAPAAAPADRRAASVIPTTDAGDHQAPDEEPKGSMGEMLMIMGGGALVVGGIFAACRVFVKA